MGIDFRGEDGFVPQHFLHHTQVGAVFYQVRRERMAEGMRGYFLVDAGRHGLFFHQVEHRNTAQGPTVLI